MIRYFLFFTLILSSILYAQEKYFIYFSDKGSDSKSTLNKNGELYKQTLSKLSSKAIERRMKVMGDNFITYEDLPVNQSYKDGLAK